MSGNATGDFNAQPNGRSGSSYEPYASGNVSVSGTYAGAINTNTGNVKNSYHIDVSHTHDFTSAYSGESEARPNNFTQIIWKRVS